MDKQGKQLVTLGDAANNAQFFSRGSKLIITKKSNDGISAKTLGSCAFLCYYCQKPRPSPINNVAITTALASRFTFYF